MKLFDLYIIDVKDWNKHNVWSGETYISIYAHNKLEDLAGDDRVYLDRIALAKRFVKVPDLIQVIPAILHCENSDIECWIVASYKSKSGLANGSDGYKCYAILQEDFTVSANYLSKEQWAA